MHDVPRDRALLHSQAAVFRVIGTTQSWGRSRGRRQWQDTGTLEMGGGHSPNWDQGHLCVWRLLDLVFSQYASIHGDWLPSVLKYCGAVW